MGMSSSQARLLTLTARMHDIEYKAQRIEAQKLQMANESRRVYEAYLDALDAKKIQFKTMNNDGSITFIDASLNRLENGAVPGWEDDLTSNKTFLLINHATDELYLTPAFAAEYGFENGQELGYDGTLDDYLTDNNAEKEIIDIYGPDYDNPIAWVPVENGRVEDHIPGDEGTTVWALSGDIQAATVPAPGEYTLSQSLDDVVTIINNPQPAQPPTITPVADGFSVVETSAVTGCSVTFPSSYQSIATTTYQFKGDTETLFTDVIGSLVYDPLSGYTNMRFTSESGTIGSPVYYVDTDTSTFKDVLNTISYNNPDFTYSAPTGGAISFSYNNGYMGLEIWDTSAMQNSDVNIADCFTRSFTWSAAQDITLGTTLNDLKYSNLSFDENDTNSLPQYPIIYVDNTPYTYTSFSGVTEEQFGNWSLQTYISKIEQAAGVTINVQQSEGRITSLGIDGNHTISFQNVDAGAFNSSVTRETQTNVNINLDALAKNILLAQAIKEDMSEEDYQSNLTGARLAAIKTALGKIKNYANPKYLARIYDDLNKAFESNDPGRIGQIYSNINDYLLYFNESSPSAYIPGMADCEAFDGDSYNFNVVEEPIGNPTYSKGQPASVGFFEVDHNPEDVRLLLAEAVLNDKTQSPSEFLNNPSNILNELTIKEMACILSYYGTDDWDSVVAALRTAVNSGNKEDIGDYLTINSDGVSMASWGGSFSGSAVITEYPPSSNVTIPSSADDILDQLAFGIYSAHQSSYANPQEVKDRLSAIFGSGDSRLASISTFFDNPSEWAQILNQLYNQINGGAEINSRYTNQFEGYNVTYGEDRINFTSSIEGATDPVNGKVHMATTAAIISNIEYAFKRAGITSPSPEAFVQDKSLEQLYVINNIVCEYLSSGGEDASLITALVGGSIPASSYPSSQYDYIQDISGTCRPTAYAQKVVEQKEVWKKDDNYYKLVNEYNLQQKFKGLKVKIIEEPLASSVDFVSNFLTFDNAYIVEFDKNSQEITDTSVATNTNLQEVADEKDLKKAEAKYEADMKRIDMKDRRYDTQLAALDNERNAVKQEMETVKTVAKDNVDRTFRLFS